jgi:autotransporter-associated beta strand protein
MPLTAWRLDASPQHYSIMKFPLFPAGFLLAFLLLFSATASAATLTYNGGVSGAWQNGGGGWLDGGTPVNWNNTTPDSAVFTGTTPTSVTIAAAGVTVDDISVNAGTYSIAGSGTLTLANTTWSVASGLTNTVSAALAGTTGLIKAGQGVLSLTETNKTFTGVTTINGGAILITNAVAGSLGSSNTTSVTLDGGALYTQFAANTTVNYAITVGAGGGEIRNLGGDPGRFTLANNRLNGAGVLTLSFGSSATRFILGGTTNSTQTNFTGKWVVTGGSNVRFVDLYSSVNFGKVTGDDAVTLQNGANLLLRAGTYQTNATGGNFGLTVGSGGGRLNIGGSSTVVLANKLSGAVGNTLTLGVENGSILVLSNTANSYLGDTAIIANSSGTTGIVRLGVSEVISEATNSGNVSVGSGTTFDMNGFNEAVGGLTGTGSVDNRAGLTSSTLTVGGNNQSTSFTGTLSNSGSSASLALVKTGAGTLTLSNSASAYIGGTTVRGGRLVVNDAGSLGSGSILLQANSTNRSTLVLNAITMTGKTLTMDSSTNRSILLSGGVSGATWNGDIVLTGGTSANGTTEIANDTGNGPLTVAGTITGSITGGTLTFRGAGTTVTNVLSASINIGSTPITKTDDGVWQITSSGNTWSGTTISAGTLSVGNGGATGELSGGGITNNATLVVNRTGAISVTNAISGSGTLVKTGAGTLTLSGSTANTYAGATTISNGTVQVSKTAGVDAIAGSSLTVSSGAVLLLSASDQVNASTAITLSGGTIRRDGAVGEVFGSLTLNADSFLDYGSGAAGTLRFGSYTPTFTLTVNNFSVGSKLQFGNSISAGDLSTRFSFSSAYATGTEGGFFTITAIPEPSTVIASILLAGILASGPAGRLVRRRFSRE